MRNSTSIRSVSLAAVALIVIAGFWIVQQTVNRNIPAPTKPVATQPNSADESTTPAHLSSSNHARPVDREAQSDLAELFGPQDPAWAWSRIDLDAIRLALPDNVFWTMAVPSDNPDVIAQRAATRARWNQEFGQIQANRASADQIRAYYERRQQLSTDYVQFANHLLDSYQAVLPERDIGMLELARRLHQARLVELPRQQAEAIERSEAFARARDAWQASQEEFSPDS